MALTNYKKAGKERSIFIPLSPSMKLTLSQWAGLSTKNFQPKFVNEES